MTRAKWATSSVCLLLFALTLALFWPARQFDFIQFDDPDYVFENPVVRQGLTWNGIVWSLVDAHSSNWHPVTWMSHMLDCQFFGLKPGAHHLVSVLVHSLNAALLFLLFQNLTGAFWRSAFVAAVFAWHPLRVESVAWVAERKDVLSAFFFFLTLLAYARYVADARKRAEGDPNAACRTPLCSLSASNFYLLSLFFFCLGLMSKPMLVTVPFVLLLLDYWPIERFNRARPLENLAGTEGRSSPAAPLAPQHLPWPGLIREKVPFLLLAFAMGLIAYFAQKQSGALVPLKAEGIGFRLETAVSGYLLYLCKVLWPKDLSFLYLRPETFPLSFVLSALVVLSLISVAVVYGRRRRPYLVTGWLWFLVILLPVSGLVQTGLQSIADRYTYLPAIGLALAAAWVAGAFAAGERLGIKLVFAIVALGLLACCAGATQRQLAYWRNTETLMNRALELDPKNYVAHNLLADYYTKINRPEEARAHRQRYRELAPAIRGEHGR